GWRLVFLINVPIGLVVLPLAIRSLPSGASHPNLKLDVGGVWLVGLALVAIIYPLIQGQTDGWPAWTFALLAAGAVLLYVFVRYERRRSHNALIVGMVVSGMLIKRLGRHLLHIGILFIAAGTTTLALMLTGLHNASTWDLVPGLLLVGAGVGIVLGQLIQFIL